MAFAPPLYDYCPPLVQLRFLLVGLFHHSSMESIQIRCRYVLSTCIWRSAFAQCIGNHQRCMVRVMVLHHQVEIGSIYTRTRIIPEEMNHGNGFSGNRNTRGSDSRESHHTSVSGSDYEKRSRIILEVLARSSIREICCSSWIHNVWCFCEVSQSRAYDLW